MFRKENTKEHVSILTRTLFRKRKKKYFLQFSVAKTEKSGFYLNTFTQFHLA